MISTDQETNLQASENLENLGKPKGDKRVKVNELEACSETSSSRFLQSHAQVISKLAFPFKKVICYSFFFSFVDVFQRELLVRNMGVTRRQIQTMVPHKHGQTGSGFLGQGSFSGTEYLTMKSSEWSRQATARQKSPKLTIAYARSYNQVRT